MYIIIFITVLLRITLSDQLDCTNEYCSGKGTCHNVSGYLSPFASLECKPGWIKGKDACYKLIWELMSREKVIDKCLEYGAGIAPELNPNQMSVLSSQLEALMNETHIPNSERRPIWISNCTIRGCKALIAPFYNSFFLTYNYLALPLCMLPQNSLNSRQCKCSPGWGGERCDKYPYDTDTVDYMVCKRMSCLAGTKLHIYFAAYGYYPGVKVCKPLTYIKDKIEQNKDLCIAPNSLTAVKYWCEGKQNCEITDKHLNSSFLNPRCQLSNGTIEVNTLVVRTSCKPETSFYCPPLRNPTNSISTLNISLPLSNYRDSCWYIIKKEMTWTDAIEYCSTFGGKLAPIPKPKKIVIPAVLIVQEPIFGELLDRFKTLDMWVGGFSYQSRNVDKIPEPSCSSIHIENRKIIDWKYSTTKNCSFITKNNFSICAMPPSIYLSPPPLPTTTTARTTTNTTISIIPTTNGQEKIFCKEKIFKDSRGESIWPQTEGNKIQTISCPGNLNSHSTAYWFCNITTREFYPPSGPNWSECRSLSNWEELFKNESISSQPDKKAQIVLEEIKKKPLYGSDLIEVLDLVEQLKQQNQIEMNSNDDNKLEIAQNFTEQVTNIIDQMLDQENTEAWLDYTNKTELALVSTNLLTSVDTLGYSLASALPINSPITLSKKAFDMTLINIDPIIYQNKSIITKFTSESIQIPNDVLNISKTSVQIVFTKFRNLTALLPTETLTGVISNQTFLNSHVIGASINGSSSFLFKDNYVIIIVEHIKQADEGISTICTFWNIFTGNWDTNGCVNKMTNRTHTICHCNHLTNFAVLMDIHGTIKPDSIHNTFLTWITILGCSLSIICLSITFFLLLILRALWSLRSTIHCNLSACLVVAQLILLFGMDQTENKILCATIAGFLHFFWLAAFAWVGLEGFHIYVLVIKIFNTQGQKVWLYYLAGYGFPSIIVAVSALINPSGYGTEKYCWLSTQNGFIFTFAGPILAIILFNIVIFILAMKAAASVKNQRNNKTLMQKTKVWIRRSAALIPLLGLTWLFGFMYADSNSIVFAYLFTIFNSIQGLFIFIFHCAMNEKIQKALMKCIPSQKNLSSSVFYTKSRSSSISPTVNLNTTSTALSSSSSDHNSALIKDQMKNRRIQNQKRATFPIRLVKWRRNLNKCQQSASLPDGNLPIEGVSYKLIQDSD